jgi:molybdenum cofactor cytidylyltransferase
MISCIVLAAGLSSRFLSPKALAKTEDGQTVLEYLQKMLLASSVEEIVIVVGADVSSIKPAILKHEKIKTVYNKDYYLGQTSSFKAGLNGVSKEAQGVFLLPVDFPCVKAETLHVLEEYFFLKKTRILIPIYEDKKGHPPLFSMDLKQDFLKISDDQGINEIARQRPEEVTLLAVADPGILLTFNTQEEFLKVRGFLRKTPNNEKII